MMTTKQAEQLLMEYPLLWQSYRAKREQILHGGRSSSDWIGIYYGGGGTYSDKTAAKAVKLAGMACNERMLQGIGKWIAEQLPADCRAILIDLWRGYGWAVIARRQGVMQWRLMTRWKAALDSLGTYLTASVGRV